MTKSAQVIQHNVAIDGRRVYELGMQLAVNQETAQEAYKKLASSSIKCSCSCGRSDCPVAAGVGQGIMAGLAVGSAAAVDWSAVAKQISGRKADGSPAAPAEPAVNLTIAAGAFPLSIAPGAVVLSAPAQQGVEIQRDIQGRVTGAVPVPAGGGS